RRPYVLQSVGGPAGRMNPSGVRHLASGRIIAQPMRNSGRRPCTGRSNARGTSETIAGKRAFISGGGVPDVSVVGQTMIAPLDLTSFMLTHGERSGVASRNTLGRLGAPIATSSAVRGSPATIGNGAPMR